MSKLIKKNRFIWLLVALIGLMLAGAFSNDLPNTLTLELIEYSSVALLLLALQSLRADRKQGRWFNILLGVILADVVLRGTTQHYFFEYSYLALLLTFFLAAAWIVGREVLLTGNVDLNVIAGSVALYLLIGFIWSNFYTVLLVLSPGALAGIEPAAWYDNLPLTTYFSFVTLTTLGFGDISPATPIARVLVTLEAVAGSFYLAVIVASLVGAIRLQKKD